MTFLRRIFCAFAISVSLIGFSQMARAHGELLIRIADLTKQLQTATTNKAELYLARGELHREDKNWDAAESDYARAEQLNPKLEIDFYRGKLLFDSEKFDAGRGMFDKAIAQNPRNGDAFVGRARCWLKLNNRGKAIADFQKGIELIPDPAPEIFLELAQTEVADGNIEFALKTLDSGIKMTGTDLTLQSYALELELGRKNFDAALNRVDAILKTAPRKESWLTQRAEILLALGREKEAMQAFDTAEAAIHKLPHVLQQASPMQKLEQRINAGREQAKKSTAN
jgi:tetratricopeptide (TPR) repeat protein